MKRWWVSFWSAYLWACEISCPSCTTFGQTRCPALVLDTGTWKNTLQMNQHASIHSQKEVKQKRFNISARFNWSYFVNYTVRHKLDKSAIQHIFVLHTGKETIIINTFLTYTTTDVWGIHDVRMYLWWSLCPLYLLACQVRVAVGDSGLSCCACVTPFER